jgi:hypothetical protein
MVNGRHQRLRPVRRAQLFVQARDVGLGGGLADEHPHGDRRDRQAVAQQAQHLCLPRAEREPFLRRLAPGERHRQPRRGERRRRDRRVPDGREHLLDRRGLADEGRNAGFQRPEQHVILALRGQDDDAKVGVAVPELPGQPQAVPVGQVDLHGHHVRACSFHDPLRVGR